MDKYDSGKMRNCAEDIINQMKTYTSAKEAIDSSIMNLKNNQNDDTNTEYARKYNSEAKVAAENVEKIMKQFADLLNQAAEEMEEIHRKAQADLG